MLVEPQEFTQVRAALDVSLSADDLPDTVIALPIYLGAADAEIKRRDPNWATRDEDALARLRRAVIYLTAASLAPAVPELTQERYPEGYSYARANSYVKRSAELRQLAEAELALVLAPSEPETLSMPTFFGSASGRRGQ